ncbi:WD repeat-containing protein 86 isoform X3 [Pongo abelii]|uniref:WD repeat-containing protein 86 isoform X3 n=1 Tax=Pongo abelii TaxID=9601 RepID=UPI0023E7E75E|nr:WD repeat-containing protein 86 isoform X3 [Pongo abelii]
MGGGGSALRVCADHRGGINWLSLSPDGQRLLTGSEDGTARLWSTADGQCCALLQGHESYVTFCQLEDEAAFTCSADCTIRRWDVLTGQCLQVYRGHTSIVNRLKTLHPQKLFNPGQDERVVLPYLLPRPLPTAPGELLWGCWRDPSGASKLGPCCRILVANNQLFSSSYDRTARVWSVDKGQMSQEFRGHRNCMLTLAYSAPWDLPSTPCVEEAAAGGLLVTGSTDGTAKVWQVASGCCHQTLRGHTGAVLCLVLDTPSHTAFTGSTDATIRAWDILSGEQLRVFREHQGSVICLERERSGGLQSCPSCRPSLLLLAAGEPTRVLWQRGQDRQVLAGRHRGVCAHVHGPQTQRERPQVPRGHLVHGQRRRLRPGLRRAVWRAAEGVPGPHIHHQLHPAYRLAGDARPCARRCTARCSTPPRTTAPCASGTCAGSEVPRGPLRPRAASRASSATKWAAPPRPCSRPDPAGPLQTPAQTPSGSQSAPPCYPRWWRPMAGEERGSPGGRRARRRRLVFLWWPGGAGSGSARPGDRSLFPFRVAPVLPPHP